MKRHSPARGGLSSSFAREASGAPVAAYIAGNRARQGARFQIRPLLNIALDLSAHHKCARISSQNADGGGSMLLDLRASICHQRLVAARQPRQNLPWVCTIGTKVFG
jgi:hypothetical protein